MPPKRKKPTKAEDDEVKAGSHVYVLTKKVYNHADRGWEDELVGIYNSKNAAVASAGDVETDGYGTFNEAINDDMFKDCHEDNRNAAPDDGLLLQIGHRDVGEGDNAQLFIEKTVVLGMPDPSTKKEASKKKAALSTMTTADYFGY